MTVDRFDGHEAGPADADASVVFLHGLGADCYDFAPIVDELAPLLRGARVRFVFPNAPVRPVTLNNGFRMRAWYDIAALDFDERSQDEAGIRESVALARALCAREEARGVPAGRIVVGGFSQGGAVAILAGVSAPRRLAGVIALSTYLLFPGRLLSEVSGAARGTPFFMAHGPADPIVPLAGGEHARDRLREAGFPVEWRTYPMPHAVHPDEIGDMGRFLAGVLAPE
jgi:phospholipase/carboxylesterase